MKKVRKLPNRKVKFSKGVAIRVSDLVFLELQKMQPQQHPKSWDCIFRRMLGLPDRRGNSQTLIEGILETITGRFFLREPHKSWNTLEQNAYEIAFLAAAKQKLKIVPKPIRMRELP